jgi:3-hydroxy-5-methyl-1-naphthoate 3-O-methyltransferase
MPQVTPVTRQYAEKFGVAAQYDYIDGDLHTVDFGKERYDLIILGHIVHGEGRERGQRLLARCADALRERGMLLIAEFIPNDDRSGPPLPMLFGLNMMVHVPEGDVFTMKEYRAWLKAAGFRNVKTIRTPSAPSPLLLATK